MKYSYGIALVLSLITLSCNKEEAIIQDDPYATPEQSHGLIRSMTLRDANGDQLVYTYFYNLQLNVKKIEITREGQKSFQINYTYYPTYILRFIADSLGNNRSFSDSILLNNKNLVSRWIQYIQQTNGNLVYSFCQAFEYDSGNFITKAWYHWDTYCNDTSVKPIIYEIAAGKTITAINYQPNSIPPVFHRFAYTYYEDKQNTLDYSYAGQSYRGKVSLFPLKRVVVSDTLGLVLSLDYYTYEYSSDGFIVKQIFNGTDTTYIEYY